MKRKNACEKRVYNGEIVIFFTKSKFAQDFVIKTINEKLKLPGIIARGPLPRVKTKPNLLVIFPAVLDRMKPDVVLSTAISMHTDADCNQVAKHFRVSSLKRFSTKSKCEFQTIKPHTLHFSLNS